MIIFYYYFYNRAKKKKKKKQRLDSTWNISGSHKFVHLKICFRVTSIFPHKTQVLPASSRHQPHHLFRFSLQIEIHVCLDLEKVSGDNLHNQKAAKIHFLYPSPWDCQNSAPVPACDFYHERGDTGEDCCV